VSEKPLSRKDHADSPETARAERTSSTARRWVVVVVLCVLAVLSTTALTPEPAYAQSPYDAWLLLLQTTNQTNAQSLETYNSMDAATRARADAQMPALVDQGLQQMYLQMPATYQAKLDEQIRQMTGYATAPQFFQTMLTVPSYCSGLTVVISALSNLTGGAQTPTFTVPDQVTAPPSTFPPTTAPVTTTSPPGMATIVFSKGADVSVKGPDGQWRPVSKSPQVIPTSEILGIRTGKKRVVVNDLPRSGCRIVASPHTELQAEDIEWLTEEEQGSFVWKLFVGTARFVTGILPVKGEVRSPGTFGGFRGTDFTLDVTPARTALAVFEGTVEFSDLEKVTTVLVEAGEFSVTLAGGSPSEPQSLDDTNVFQQYGSLFESDEEIQAVKDNMEELVRSREAGSRLGYLLLIPAAVIIALVIGLAIRRSRRMRQV
jgi:hypothetical protein